MVSRRSVELIVGGGGVCWRKVGVVIERWRGWPVIVFFGAGFGILVGAKPPLGWRGM